ncbi:CST complex subunit ctc1 [Entophlyctis luteolus]|nr:CST complex subunit ctc1 [Entophlyctis luteolus]
MRIIRLTELRATPSGTVASPRDCILVGMLLLAPDGSWIFTDDGDMRTPMILAGSFSPAILSLSSTIGHGDERTDTVVLVRNFGVSAFPDNQLKIHATAEDMITIPEIHELHPAHLSSFHIDDDAVSMLFSQCQFEAKNLLYRRTISILQSSNLPVNLSDISSLRSASHISLFGEIKMKSAILIIRGSYFFFVEIVCDHFITLSETNLPERTISTIIMFEQRKSVTRSPHEQLWYLFGSLSVGHSYLFTNLTPKQIRFQQHLPNPLDNKSNIKKLLIYNPNSRIHLLDPEGVKYHIKQQIKEISENFLHHPPLQSATFERLVSYVGTITKIVNIDAGRYELDSKYDLYLTYHQSSYTTFEWFLIPGAEVRLHNVHLVLHEKVSIADFGDAKRAVFVACPVTTIEVSKLSLPMDARLPGVEHHTASVCIHDPRRRANLKTKWSGLNLRDLLLLDDIFSTVMQFTLSHCGESDNNSEHDANTFFSLSKEILKRTKGFCEWPAEAGEPKLSSVLRHEHECNVSQLRYTQPFLVSSEMILHSTDGAVENFVSEILKQKLHGSRQQSNDAILCRNFSMEEMGVEDCFLLGYLQFEMGQLFFRDSSGTRPALVVIPKCDESDDFVVELSDLGSCVAILKFEAVVEFLGFSCEKDSALTPIAKRYLSFFGRDCLFVSRFGPVIQKQNPCAQVAVGNFRSLLIKVESKSMRSLDIVEDGTMTVKGRLTGVAWICDPDGKPGEAIENVAVILSGETLKIWACLEVGESYHLSNVKCRIFNDDEESSDKVTCIGLVVSKSLITSSVSQSMHYRISAMELFKQLNIGVGRYGRTLALKVTDSNSRVAGDQSNVLTVYLDCNNLGFELGIVPGALVEFRRLALKFSARPGVRGGAKTAYGVALCDTGVQVFGSSCSGSTDSQSHIELPMIHTLPRLFLIDVFSISSHQQLEEFSVICIVTHIEEIRLWCVCGTCGVKFGIAGFVGCACRKSSATKGGIIVHATGKIHIDDGTYEATVFLDSFNSVCGLLGLTPNTAKLVEEAVIEAIGHDVSYNNPPPWFGDNNQEDPFFNQVVYDDKDNIARLKLSTMIQNVDKNSGFALGCRLHGQLSDEDTGGEFADESEAGGSISPLYSNLGVQDLSKRKLKLAEGFLVDVITPPRITLGCFNVERLNALSECMYIIENSK